MTNQDAVAQRSIWPKWGWIGPGVAVLGLVLGLVAAPWQAIPFLLLGLVISGVALLVGALTRGP